jgi:hypothetical protein
MKVRFQADADLNEIIVKAVLRREPSIDFQTAHAAGLAGLSDQDVLSLAARQRRLLATHDRRTMPAHFAKFVATVSSAGVLVIPQTLAVARVVDDLLLIWAASDLEDWIDQIHVLPL